MLPQIFMFVDSSKTQKLKYLESETLFFLQIKLFIQYILVAIMWQKKKKFSSGGNLTFFLVSSEKNQII